MLPDHYRTDDEINGTDSSMYTIEWYEDRKTGVGTLSVRHDCGELVGTVEHDEPIGASTDSWAIAEKVTNELELPAPKWVEHDKTTIFFG